MKTRRRRPQREDHLTAADLWIIVGWPLVFVLEVAGILLAVAIPGALVWWLARTIVGWLP